MSQEQSPATSHALTGVLDDIEEYLDQRQDVRDGEDGVQLPNEAMSLLSRLAEARTIWARSALSETAPSAWSPISKSGLLRGIRHGKPSDEDLAIAKADGDTIRYFYDSPSETIPSAIEQKPLPREYEDMRQRNRTLELALIEIMKGEGPFSRDPLTHATSTIESMKKLATGALYATGNL